MFKDFSPCLCLLLPSWIFCSPNILLFLWKICRSSSFSHHSLRSLRWLNASPGAASSNISPPFWTSLDDGGMPSVQIVLLRTRWKPCGPRPMKSSEYQLLARQCIWESITQSRKIARRRRGIALQRWWQGNILSKKSVVALLYTIWRFLQDRTANI